MLHWIERLFPTGLCALCLHPVRPGAPWACTACLRSLPLVSGHGCQSCARPLAGTRDGYCRFCRSSPPPFSWAVHLAVYDGVMRSHLYKLKFENRRAIARPLGVLLGQRLRKLRRPARHAVIVPMPLHPGRLRDRGYNQAALVAEAVRAVVQRPIVDRSLVRRRPTLAQAKLSVTERRENVRGAFAVVDPGAVRGRDVILVDDVYTTGATCTAAATALLKAGASSIGIACLAVAVSDRDFLPEPNPEKRA